MYCPKCEKEIEDESTKFCPECGTLVTNELSKTEEASHPGGINLRMAMFAICIISAIGALFVYLYGHNAFYDDVWMSSSPNSTFWIRGNGIGIFIFLIAIAIISFIIGICYRRKK